jgi:Flp pilus assembly protein TadB
VSGSRGKPVEEMNTEELERMRGQLHRAVAISGLTDLIVAVVAFAIGSPLVGVGVLLMGAIGLPVCRRIFDRQIDERIKKVSGPQPY